MHRRTASQPPTTSPLLQEQGKTDEPVSIAQPVDALAGAPTLINFLHTVPAPLVALLVRLAPPISPLRHVFQIISWQTSWVDSWLLLGLWWAVVLFAEPALRSVVLSRRFV